MTDLRLDVWPRFRRSLEWEMYIRVRHVAQRPVALSDFTILGVLGRGAHGIVHACRKNNTQQLFAAKFLSVKSVYGRDALAPLMTERLALIALRQSRFICGLRYAIRDQESLIFILELCLSGNLRSHLMELGQFPEQRARYHAAEILLGLEHIHAKRIVFRDLKLDNILLDPDGHCKIIDFGLSLILDNHESNLNDDAYGYHGTPGYTSPEIICGQPSTHLSDYFSFGVVLYMMLSGMAPFAGFGIDADAMAVQSQVNFDDEAFTSDSISLLSGLLQKDPTQRLGAISIDQIKQHNFFRGVDWARLEMGAVPAPFRPAIESVPKPRLRVRIKGPHGPVLGPYRRLRLPDEFHLALDSFPYINEEAAQDDIVQILERHLNPDQLVD